MTKLQLTHLLCSTKGDSDAEVRIRVGDHVYPLESVQVDPSRTSRLDLTVIVADTGQYSTSAQSRLLEVVQFQKGTETDELLAAGEARWLIQKEWP